MADTKTAEKEDIYALLKPNGSPAYPKMIYKETGEKYDNGEPVTDKGTVVNSPEEHKALLDSYNKNKAWAGK